MVLANKGSDFPETQVKIPLCAWNIYSLSDNENDEMILGKIHNQSKATIKPM